MHNYEVKVTTEDGDVIAFARSEDQDTASEIFDGYVSEVSQGIYGVRGLTIVLYGPEDVVEDSALYTEDDITVEVFEPQEPDDA